MSRSVRPVVVLFALTSALIPAVASAEPDRIPPNAIRSSMINDGAVKAVDVSDREVQLRVKPGCGPDGAIRRVRRDGSTRCVTLGDGTAAPTGPAGGDLAGTYPNPDIAAGAVNSGNVEDNSLTAADIDESTLSGFWRLGGNAGTTPATDFLGTTDNQPLNINVNGARAFRLEPGTSPNVIGGIAGNSAGAGTIGATIAGGGSSNTNSVTANYGTVGGGEGNIASGLGATVAGGRFGSASGQTAVVAGGNNNTSSGVFSTTAGGSANVASGAGSVSSGGANNSATSGYAVVAGGANNTASGSYSSILGSADNVASASYATAIGTGAVADDAGATVIASPGAFPFNSTANSEFAVRATGGARIVSSVNGFGAPNAGVELPPGASAWSALSDVNSKRGFEPVDGRQVLAKLADLPISTWSWKAEPGVLHMGPMAQDFRAAFGLGDDPKRISTVDPDGVALAAIQGLQSKLRTERRKRLDLERRLAALERQVDKAD